MSKNLNFPDNTIASQGLFDYCFYNDVIDKDYNHCGIGCGERGQYGGGYAINTIDICCYNHDLCYHTEWENVSCCDYDLIICADRN